MRDGICLAARDDLFVGGESEDEVIKKWERVLGKLAKHNLKVGPHKVKIMPVKSEVFGHKITGGRIRPSDHVINNLGQTTPEELTTVKKVNSWKGLYKTLIKHLPHLATYMTPFDAATASKESKEKFTWTFELTQAFKKATAHLDQINVTVLPKPSEPLFLLPDASTANLCIGWALMVQREDAGEKKLYPFQYCSAKLQKHISNWFPCETEAVGAVVAIEQCKHWINESLVTTTVLPDSKPVVEAANLLKSGRHSKNVRLQMLLTCVNRYNVRFLHNSAKAGLHVVPDTCSRLNKGCSTKDCQVERFLTELPHRVQCRAVVTLADTLLGDVPPSHLAATTSQLADMLTGGRGTIPLGNKATWRDIQQSDSNSKKPRR